jgi:hypothetical protein
MEVAISSEKLVFTYKSTLRSTKQANIDIFLHLCDLIISRMYSFYTIHGFVRFQTEYSEFIT